MMTSTTTAPALKMSPQKPNILAQIKGMKTKFTLASLTKRLSFCSVPHMEEESERVVATNNKKIATAEAETIGPESLAVELPSTSVKTQKLRFVTQQCCIPHPEKVKKGGEDAHFISSTGLAIGVADGVGGWADKGVDPSLYSKTLMREANNAFEVSRDPLESLKVAAAKANKIMGSATACIVGIDEKNPECIRLRSANLGDSGYMLIRKGEIIFRTKEQQFNFNFPYQLGPTSRAQAKDADIGDMELLEGDKIVLGTDGLFDNLFDHEILEIVNRMTTRLNSQEEALNSIKQKLLNEQEAATTFDANLTVAEHLARRASEKSRSSTCKTPFAQNAKLHGHKIPGGKLDDITVIFAVVTSESSSVTLPNPTN